MKDTTKIYLSKQGFKELKKKVAKLEREQKMLEIELRDGDVKEDLLRQNDIFARIDAIRSEINEKNFQIHNEIRKFQSVRSWSFSIVQLGES